MRVAIVGWPSQPENFDAKNYDEVWPINAVNFPWLDSHVTQRCQLHPYAYLKDAWLHGIDGISAWLHERPGVPLLTLDKWPDAVAPNQTLLPKDALMAMPRGGYHCCSADWLIAYAVLRGARAITLHGISSNIHSDQPLSARACIEYWCGVATGRGIKVTATKDCDLFCYTHLVMSHATYGFDTVPLIEDRR